MSERPARPYFAYGSNMDPVQMASRCPGALATGTAVLRGHRVAFVTDLAGFEGGVATVVPDEASDVWGVLWQIDDEHLAALDEWEGYPLAYTRPTMTVEAPEPVSALVYVATFAHPETPSERYLAGILRGARSFELPEEYVGALRRCADRLRS